ncbi:MAG: AMP-binding protein, partial [Nevskia sp.]|uniref:AMP-binding protein n=1 Tax=Nevskia sp. TaxID=1929292 RepID=UPI0040360671
LRVVAVGGASVSPRLIDRAVALGLPVYEGYGLSECGSVVALNRPGAARPGSVGRPLPGLDVQVSDRGELVVSGRGFLGYVGEAARAADAPVATGDLGHFDADGYLHLDGRSKNLIVTAFGRNVSPEWIERELTVAAAIPQAAVFGDGQPSLSAVIASTASDAAIDAALAAVNALLPDYARVRRWLRADAPFSTANQQLTANGRPRRAAIVAAYGARLTALHEETETP